MFNIVHATLRLLFCSDEDHAVFPTYDDKDAFINLESIYTVQLNSNNFQACFFSSCLLITMFARF